MPSADDDLARLLPEAPPPRPARREEALAAAMRRFDGIADPAPARPAARPAWGGISRGQIGVFASIALAALIGIPIALQSPSPVSTPPAVQQPGPVAGRPAAPGAPPVGVPGPATAPTGREEHERARAPVAPALTAAKPGAGYAPPPPPPPAAILGKDAQEFPALQARAAPAPLPPAGQSAKSAGPARFAAPSSDNEIVVAGRRREERFQSAPVVVDAITAADVGSFDDGTVIVTGTRRSGNAAAARRGDWNACTVDDPEQDLRGCKGLLGTGASGSKGQAGEQVAEGLDLAWNGEWDEAIAAFDRAIALRPRMAIAWLNRGLAWQHKGDLARAASDLGRAIRYAPNEARGYYQRSLVRRQQGYKQSADADAAQAAALDPRYRAIVD